MIFFHFYFTNNLFNDGYDSNLIKQQLIQSILASLFGWLLVENNLKNIL